MYVCMYIYIYIYIYKLAVGYPGATGGTIATASVTTQLQKNRHSSIVPNILYSSEFTKQCNYSCSSGDSLLLA